MQKKVEMLIEQTDFLLEKQKEALRDVEEVFTDLVKAVQAKAKTSGLKPEEVKSLANIEKMVVDKMNEVSEQMSDDIEFLVEQLETLTIIATTKDQTKAASLLKDIFDDEDELIETEEFKANIKEDSEIAKQDLISVTDDLKTALEEGNIRDVELLLETMGDGEIEIEFEEGEKDEGCECDECDEDECKDSCCQSGKRDMERVHTDIFKCCGDEKDSCCSGKNKPKK